MSSHSFEGYFEAYCTHYMRSYTFELPHCKPGAMNQVMNYEGGTQGSFTGVCSCSFEVEACHTIYMILCNNNVCTKNLIAR